MFCYFLTIFYHFLAFCLQFSCNSWQCFAIFLRFFYSFFAICLQFPCLFLAISFQFSFHFLATLYLPFSCLFLPFPFHFHAFCLPFSSNSIARFFPFSCNFLFTIFLPFVCQFLAISLPTYCNLFFYLQTLQDQLTMPAHSATDINPGSNGFTDPHGSTKEFVISGLSGRLPESDNIAEFREHLINGDDMVTDDGRRWEPGKQQLWFPMVTDDGRRWEPVKQLLWFPMVT